MRLFRRRPRKATCGLCLMQEISVIRWACDFCGVTGEEMCRAGLR